MIRPRWKKILSDFWENKSRSLLVIFSIAVGVFSIGMIAGAYVIISTDMSNSYARANPANIEIWTDDFDENLTRAVLNLEGVKDVEGRRFTSMRVEVGNNQWASIDLVAIEDFLDSKINLISPISGSMVPTDYEVLLERDALNDISAGINQTLTFKLPDGSDKSLIVAGFVQDQTTGAGDFLAAPIGFISLDTLEKLHQPRSFNRLLVTVETNPNNENYIRQIAAQVVDKIEKSGRQVYRQKISKTNEHPMTSTVQAVLGVLGALGILIVLLSSSLITNTLNALLNQHLRYIGVMKLIGARNIQILFFYTILILGFGVVALIIAIPAGAQGAYALSLLIADKMNFKLTGFRVIPSAILIQAIISLFVPLFAGFIPIRRGSNISVRKAISGDFEPGIDNQARQEQVISPRKTAAFISQKIPRPILISFRNTFRRKGRLLLTLFTLTMAGAIFIAVFNVRVSLNEYIQQIGKYFLADVTINFDRPYRIAEIQQVAQRVSGVEAVEGWAFTSAEIVNSKGSAIENIQILAPPANSILVEPIILSGRWIKPGDKNAIAISEAILADLPSLKVGNSINLKINGQTQNWVVVGIFKFVNSQNVIAYANYDHISRLLNLSKKSFSYRVVTKDHSESNQRSMGVVLDQHFRANGYYVREVEPGLSSLDTASEGLNVLVTFLLIMALLTAAVGSMGLTGTMGMNVLERTREIGIMRSIGAVDSEIMKSVIFEGMVIGIISWFLGALLSFPISIILLNIISLAIFSTPIDQVFTFEGFGIWLAMVLVLSSTASILPARNAARLTIREVLAYE